MKVKVKWCESLVQHKGAENAPPSSKPLQSADAVLAVGGISRGSRREGKVGEGRENSKKQREQASKEAREDSPGEECSTGYL